MGYSGRFWSRGSVRTMALAVAVILGAGSSASAQYAGLGCQWTDKTIAVHFNPGSIVSSGLSIDRLRGELVDAMATWNEEGQGQYDLYYGGDTPLTSATPGIVVVNHPATWACSDNVSTKSFFAGSGSCDTAGNLLFMVMQDSCNPGTARKWRTGWPGATYDFAGLAGFASYEGVATFGLGQMLGLPSATGTGVMAPVTWHTGAWHLFPIDTDSIRTQSGSTLRRAVTSTSSNFLAWSATSPISSLRTTFPPGLDGSLSTAPGLTSASYVSFTDVIDVKRGAHGSWSAWSPASPPFDVHQWASIANSGFGETLVVWPDDCTQGVSGCDIDWAWTDNSGATWTRGTLTDANTFSKAFVEYDASRARFVLAYLDSATSRIHLRSAHAPSAPVWSSVVTLGTDRYRYLGGMVFDPANGGPGLLIAASNAEATKGHIRQLGIKRSGTGYALDGMGWLQPQSAWAHTRRPFGIAHDVVSNRTLFAWRDGGTPRNLHVCWKTGIDPSTTCCQNCFAVASPDIMNGVDAAYDRTTAQFVVGFTQP